VALTVNCAHVAANGRRLQGAVHLRKLQIAGFAGVVIDLSSGDAISNAPQSAMARSESSSARAVRDFPPGNLSGPIIGMRNTITLQAENRRATTRAMWPSCAPDGIRSGGDCGSCHAVARTISIVAKERLPCLIYRGTCMTKIRLVRVLDMRQAARGCKAHASFSPPPTLGKPITQPA